MSSCSVSICGLTLVIFKNRRRPTPRFTVVTHRSPLVTHSTLCSEVDSFTGTSTYSPTASCVNWPSLISVTLLPYNVRRPASWTRTSSGRQSAPPPRSNRIPAGTIKSIPRIASWPTIGPTHTLKMYTKFPFKVILMRVRPSVVYTASPIPTHSCLASSSIWQPTLRAKAISKMDISAPVSNNKFARSLFTFPEALAC